VRACVTEAVEALSIPLLQQGISLGFFQGVSLSSISLILQLPLALPPLQGILIKTLGPRRRSFAPSSRRFLGKAAWRARIEACSGGDITAVLN
jgi:hypothetical protein